MPSVQKSIFRLEGTFDSAAALLLRERIHVEQGRHAVLDFSHVVRFEDSTLAMLAVQLILLRRAGHGVSLRGLREHQLRILHHFGIELSADGAVRLEPDEELPFPD